MGNASKAQQLLVAQNIAVGNVVGILPPAVATGEVAAVGNGKTEIAGCSAAQIGETAFFRGIGHLLSLDLFIGHGMFRSGHESAFGNVSIADCGFGKIIS